MPAIVLLAAAPEATPIDAAGSFKEGVKAYDAGAYEQAAKSFEAAYNASGKTEILFNLGQTYRQLGDCRRAVESYDAFLAKAPADHPLFARAQAKRSELSCPAEASAPPPPPAPPAIEPPSPAPAEARSPPALGLSHPAPAPRRSRPLLHTTCLVSAGAGVALAVGGLVFGAQALAAQSSVEDAVVWDMNVVREDERGRAFGYTATVLLASSAVAGLVATASCLLR
jgi:tetratricopeptide (TPR) repeat protein